MTDPKTPEYIVRVWRPAVGRGAIAQSHRFSDHGAAQKFYSGKFENCVGVAIEEWKFNPKTFVGTISFRGDRRACHPLTTEDAR